MKKVKKIYSNVYILILVIFACFIGAHVAKNNLFDFSQIHDLALFLIISIMAAFLPVNLPKIGYVTIDSALDFAGILLFKSTASFTAIFSYLFFVIAKRKTNKQSVSQIIFNMTQIFICINLSVLVLDKLTASAESFIHSKILYLLITGLVYSITNTFLVTICLYLDSNESLPYIWFTNIKWTIPNLFALAPLGFIIAYLYNGLGIYGVIFFLVPLLLARHTFRIYMEMRGMYLDTISSLAAAIDAKDKYTHGHSDRVSQYTVAIAKEMNFSEDEIENLRYIALLHDIGKISIPETILNKPTKLSEEEFYIMKQHSRYGAEIVRKIKFLKAYDIIRHHHERFDGKGYPDSLSGKQISIGARIIAVADSFDAMTTDRPYRTALTDKTAVEELMRNSGTQFDPEIVKIFIKILPKIKVKKTQHDKSIVLDVLEEKLQEKAMF